MAPDEEVVENPAPEADEPKKEDEAKTKISRKQKLKKKKEDGKLSRKQKSKREEVTDADAVPKVDTERKMKGAGELDDAGKGREPVEATEAGEHEGEVKSPAEDDAVEPAPSRVYDDRGGRPGDWVPKTRLGRMVKSGEITTMGEALRTGYLLREPEIVDILLPELDDEVLDVNMVQRMTDSGRRVRFAITTVVGNGDGYVGLGKATGKEVGPAIRKAIDNAKLNIIEIKRGCGSWECGCGTPHSLPFQVKGKSGSAEVTFKPAPRGISLAVGDVAKHILRLAGINDSWGFTDGKTRTTVNYAKAAFDALKKLSEMRIMPDQETRLHIHTGSIGRVSEGGEEE